MRDTLRALAAAGKTVFVSSHILSEVQQLVDVVGIIARGRLVREGRVEELLREAGSIRVRVAPDEVAGAATALGPVAAGAAVMPGAGPEPGWLTVRIDPARGAEVNRALAGAGIYASRLETGRRSRACSSSSRAPIRTAAKRSRPAPTRRPRRPRPGGGREAARREPAQAGPAAGELRDPRPGGRAARARLREPDHHRPRVDRSGRGTRDPVPDHVPQRLGHRPRSHPRRRVVPRARLRGGGRGLGVVVGNPQGGRCPRREPRRLPGLDAGRGRGGDHRGAARPVPRRARHLGRRCGRAGPVAGRGWRS